MNGTIHVFILTHKENRHLIYKKEIIYIAGNNKEMSEEDYLKKHISELENKVSPQSDIHFCKWALD